MIKISLLCLFTVRHLNFLNFGSLCSFIELPWWMLQDACQHINFKQNPSCTHPVGAD